MNYDIYTDIHLFGPHALNIILKFNANCYYLGDIVDIKNALPHEIVKARKVLRSLIDRSPGRFVTGNHELSADLLKVVHDGILFIHGDIIFYDDDEFWYWRKYKKPIRSRLWKWILGIIYYVKDTHSSDLNDKYLDKAVQLAIDNNCDTIIFGHRHPDKLVDMIYRDVRIVCVPRGKTTINL